jgi:hypothetical protein
MHIDGDLEKDDFLAVYGFNNHVKIKKYYLLGQWDLVGG